MSRDKQIEEMTIALTEAQHEFDKAWHECLHNKGKQPERENVFYAKYLIEKKGYCKASEIFEEVEKKVTELTRNHLEELNKEHIKDTPLYDRHSGIIFALQRVDDFIAELKKKYTEEEK